MFITDETVNSRSQVTFFRCSLCVSEHVSAEPIVELPEQSVSQRADGGYDSVSRGVQFAI